MNPDKETKCFACKGRGCSILVNGACSSDCGFYKTEEQRKSSWLKSHKRLKVLPDWQQQFIADTYYGGQMPWLAH